ncbi:MAG: peptidoglycan DD-metalloendopeptidase family protein, partial [candidate division KSB1 bacterium]|nr:peptidoglycan DD-metalloendopeptidase family protein [candidate division KSB1 bacterium]
MQPTIPFSYQDGVLRCEGVSLEDLGERYGTPLYVYSQNGMLSAFAAIEGAFAGIPHTVCYALKANANPHVLRMLAAAGVSGYIWPFTGNISQYFSDYHDGIDIDAVGRYGDPVVAAALGEVVLVSWQEEGLGYHVIIRHRDGSETVYAHLSDVYVWQGQFVGRGQAIGAIGCTGYCTGPH